MGSASGTAHERQSAPREIPVTHRFTLSGWRRNAMLQIFRPGTYRPNLTIASLLKAPDLNCHRIRAINAISRQETGNVPT